MSARDMFEVGVGSRPGERNFWIGVVPGVDGQHASQGGFSQFGYGKVQSLTRMKAGDGFVGYAPNAAFHGRGPTRALPPLVWSGSACPISSA